MMGFSTADDLANQIYMSDPAWKAISDAASGTAVETKEENTGIVTATTLPAPNK